MCGNTSNLNSHLQQCLSVKPKNNTSSIATYFKGPTAKLPLNSKRNKELTKGLIKFIVKDLRPLSLVEGEGFREFLDLGIPEYNAPSRRTISRLIDHAALLERDNFKKYLSNISYISLTIDFWTSDSNNSYLGVTCHFIDSWTLHSRVLEVIEVLESHTSINIVSNLKSVLKTWDIENKVVAFVCDNAANMVKAINDMDKFNLVRCTAHSIQLSVNAGLKNDVTKELINKLRKIVGYFNRSSSAQSELEKEQVKYGEPQNKLVQDCKTDEWFITSAEVQNLKDLVKVLEPFKSVTNTLGGDKYVTASVANRLIKSFLNTVQTCETDSNFIKTVKLSILQDLKIRREMMSPVLSKAAALDPRFHELKFISDEQKTLIWEELETEICEMNPQSQEIINDQNKANEIENVISSDEDNPPPKKMRSLMADSDDEDEFSIGFETPMTASRQLQNYKNMTTKCHRDEDPLKWWKENSNLYPEVSKLAKKYLSIVATSVPCERLFSEAGNITSKKRSSLSPDRVNNLLLLNSYYKSTKTSDHTLDAAIGFEL
ncbi:zinc finger BED domain-containing protein 1-like [Sipha flava]|uniref:Zinc finger BED domain-containing protein 1-like n=1 Tax=Sipha flava TaxID=143950 RepID=A0A8B8G657_9HEMI|nr:zinc finger BED domain-containing protein 1-like [Sipha flava]